MNDLVKASNNLPSLANFGQALQQQALNISAAAGNGDPLLRLLKDGTWVYGADNLEVEDGTEFAINPNSLAHGFVSWTADKVVNGQVVPAEKAKVEGEVMGPMIQPKPAVGEKPADGRPWADQYSAQLKIVTGDDEGEQLLYKGTSQGLKDAFASFVPKIAARAANGETDIVPVVTFDVSSYVHKKWGKTYKPVINIIRWIGVDGEAAPVAVEDDGDIAPSAESAAFVEEVTAMDDAEGVTKEDIAAVPTPRRRRRA